MAASPFAFLRGTAALMAYDLSSMPSTGWRVQASGESTVLLLGVDSNGTVSHCLMWHASGKPDLDEAATRFARDLHFRAAPGYSWGTLRVTWGYDEP